MSSIEVIPNIFEKRGTFLKRSSFQKFKCSATQQFQLAGSKLSKAALTRLFEKLIQSSRTLLQRAFLLVTLPVFKIFCTIVLWGLNIFAKLFGIHFIVDTNKTSAKLAATGGNLFVRFHASKIPSQPATIKSSTLNNTDQKLLCEDDKKNKIEKFTKKCITFDTPTPTPTTTTTTTATTTIKTQHRNRRQRYSSNSSESSIKTSTDSDYSSSDSVSDENICNNSTIIVKKQPLLIVSNDDDAKPHSIITKNTIKILPTPDILPIVENFHKVRQTSNCFIFCVYAGAAFAYLELLILMIVINISYTPPGMLFLLSSLGYICYILFKVIFSKVNDKDAALISAKPRATTPEKFRISRSSDRKYLQFHEKTLSKIQIL